ncbi:glycosyltransferase family 4 protein [Frigoribacterium sp. 2-23]|uniref:glycosyltransferase family 4 protein n=1 Tax=Frigoribacterium sp. 2-23 TaxID=3415006 RepID=UPI003C6FFA70
MSGSEWFESQTGGLNRYFGSLFESLTNRGDVDVDATAFGESPRSNSASHSWGPVGGGTLSRFVAGRRLLNPRNVDIVDRHFCLYGPPLRRYKGSPRTVVHFQGPWASESQMSGASSLSVMAKRAFERLRYRQADHFIVLSESFKSILVSQYGAPWEAVSVIPPGVDLERFTPSPSVARDRPIVLCVRRLERRMGIDVLIEAWRDVVIRYPDAELHIVGTGTFETELHALANASPHRDSITFRGALTDSELLDAYARASFTVVPSLSLEGFGLIALESLAVGRPTIVTDCGGLPDAVIGLDPTLIVGAGNIDALSDRIIRGLDGELPSPESSRAHAERFAWDQVADHHVRLYERLSSG